MKHQVDQLELIKSDFRNFLYIAWKHLALPPPTPIQYDIAEYLQGGPKRLIIQAFRGVGNTWFASGFVVFFFNFILCCYLSSYSFYTNLLFDFWRSFWS